MASWDPEQYERYKTYRDRPALDLLVQVPGDLQPKQVWDLGCGTGEHAALLKLRHPRAAVHGLDASADMLARARQRPEAVDWTLGDIDAWTPDKPADLIFTNAALQWLPDHERLFPRLVSQLAPGGVFACQMPLSWRAPQHVALRETAADGPWAARLQEVAGVRPLLEPQAYYDALSPLCGGVDLWTTTYLHVLTSEDPVVEWMKGSGLRPYLDSLTSEESATFVSAYARRLSRAFPARADGSTLLPFERLFVVARRG